MRESNQSISKSNIAILVVGTRGDVQPFLAVAKRLQEYGHSVRLATHSEFHALVESVGVNFYPLGGDPRIIVEGFMRTRNIYLARPREIGIQMKQLKAVMDSLLPACTQPDPKTGQAFRAHAIIANPPAYDWGPLVDVVGYCFLDLGSKYEPPHEFVEWMQKGPAPIYIGFGSMPVEDSENITNIVLEALKNTGQRGILARGWGGLGSYANSRDNVFVLSDCPHDWLFPQCYAVVHHGGAGTTAAGLKAGCPTTIVPFCGDQFLWGSIMYEKGVGPAPIPISNISVESLSQAIRFMLRPQIKSRAMELGQLIKDEDGAAAAVESFHRHLPSQHPLPTDQTLEEDNGSDLVQRFFSFVGKFCSLCCDF